MAEAFHSNGLELLPTEILYGIVKRLDNRVIKRLSCISRQMGDICLPSLFRKVSIEYLHAGYGVSRGDGENTTVGLVYHEKTMVFPPRHSGRP